ncbi:MAG: T9SS type A sorting domain-containing protein [Saprospiraceae bacterium]|nr:T9SS type A sorting domain-containing protein [Saprospiraceae bacterium]MDW8483720.1 T9SS type A sorting domain-containing protein [Saprospiraceae bacterium]
MNWRYFNLTVFIGLLLFVGDCCFTTPAAAQCSMACNNFVQISLDADCEVEIEPDMILEGNGCSNGNFVVEMKINGIWVPAIVNANHVNQTLQVRVRELNSGNSCWGYVLVQDKLAPQLTCSPITLACGITTYTPQYLQNELNISNAYPTVAENCGNFTLSYVDQFTDLPCNGTINGLTNISAYVRRTWTAVDQSGNSASCMQFIYFQRRNVNQVQFPPNITISCENPNTSPNNTGVPFLVEFGRQFPLYPQNTFCELSIAYADQVLPICDGSRKILRTWTVLDWCLPTNSSNNPRQYLQVIKVEDAEGPSIDCPEHLTVNTNPWNCTRDLDLPDVLLEDNCSRIKEIWAEYTINGIGRVLPGTLKNFPGNNPWHPDTLGVLGVAQGLPLGNTLVRYIARDDCGNTSSCEFLVTVADETPPNVACVEFTKVSLGAAGVALVNAATFDKGSYDNCSPVRFKARRLNPNDCQSNERFHDQVKFCCEDVGKSIPVVLRVYDIPVPSGEVPLEFGEDHANDCVIQVSVEDKLKPTCIAPSNVTVSCKHFDPSLSKYGNLQTMDNCCVDTPTVTLDLTQFDTLCHRGTIARIFCARDCHGNSQTCSQRIVVTYEQDYFVRFPNDLIVTACDGTGNYGQPIFFGKDCEALAVSFQDEIHTAIPDGCFLIERTWTIINWCNYNPNQGLINVPNPEPNATANHPSNLLGPIVSPVGTPAPWAPTVVPLSPGAPPTNYSIFWSATANGYRYRQIIKIIDNQKPIIETCKTDLDAICDFSDNDSNLWNAMYWWDAATNNHDLCEAPVDLSIDVTDLCSGSDVNIRYLLCLDLNGDGITETVISSAQTGLGGLGWNRIRFNNASNPDYGGGELREFDFRPVPSNQKYGFALQITTSGKKKIAAVRWNTQQSPNTFVVPELPYGTHKIIWIAEDGCGNEQTCTWFFEVRDCKKPTILCKDIQVNLMPTKMINLHLTDFLQTTFDNCTPPNLLTTAIRRKGQGQGFPMLPTGLPQKTVTLTCADLGSQEVEVWSRDLAGNADFCLAKVNVQDPAGSCSLAHHASIAGSLKTEDDEGLSYATVKIQISLGGLPPVEMSTQSEDNGQFYFSNAVPLGSTYELTATKDDNPLNGVSTFDLVLINRHILGIEPLNTPYKMIAADANNSRSITTFDLVELRKLILGIYNELPALPSWRFVPADFDFPDPTNPFKTIFPEKILASNVAADRTSEHFIAIKVGDVNGNAVANASLVEERSSNKACLVLEDRYLRAGEHFTVTFQPEEVIAYQFTLTYPDLDLVDIVPGEGLSLEHFGVFRQERVLTAALDRAEGFALQFRARRSGFLSQMLQLNSHITPAEGYDANGQRKDLSLLFRRRATPAQESIFELFQNTPNPVRQSTTIVFALPQATEVTLSITDVEGRLIKRFQGYFSAGINNIHINRSDLANARGILFYQLDTPTHSATRKMFVMDE